VYLEAALMAILAVIEVVDMSSARVTMGLTTTAFFLILAVALAFFARALARLESWSRSPIVLTELVGLGMAWSFKDDPAIAVPLAIACLVCLGGLFHPASVNALETTD
jgi:hypothetical protein